MKRAFNKIPQERKQFLLFFVIGALIVGTYLLTLWGGAALKTTIFSVIGVPTIDITSGAVQTVHQTGVPHIDKSGNFKTTLGSDSFFPIGIYNPTLCQVTKTVSWSAGPATPGWNGEYRVKVHYGTSRNSGTYLLADINVGNVLTGTVGNLPPNSSLYYSVWQHGTTNVVKEEPFTSVACTTPAEDTNFTKIKNAGFNVAILEKNIYPDSQVLAKAQQENLGLVLDMRDRPIGTQDSFANLKNNPNVFGFYVGDDDLARAKFYNTDSNPANDVDVNQIYNNINTYADILDADTDKVILTAEPDIALNESSAWLNWYNQFDSIGNISFHYNYPKSNSPLIPWTSIVSVADTVKHQAQVNGGNRPSWFIAQAINLKWVIPLEFPTAVENRAMVYTSLIHGATGVFQFSSDGWFRRQPKGNPAPENQNDINWYDRHAGIKDNTPASYPGGDKWAYSATLAERTASTNLWNGLNVATNGVNKELIQLKEVILSPTATDAYRVFVDSQPSPAPIRTMLKKYNGDWYLFAVNLHNTSITGKFVFPGKNFSKAEVLFEGRNASLVASNEITEVFTAFDTNVYKLVPVISNTVHSVVKSQRKVCSLLGTNQISVGIGGQDGGTSLKIGTQSFWTFGDTKDTAGNPFFLFNSIAKSTDFEGSDCVGLTSKSSGSVAQNMFTKLSDELLVWPDGMAGVQPGYGHFYYLSVRGCTNLESCGYNSLGGAWKVRGIGLGKFDTTAMNSTRTGSCSPVTNCLFWQESDPIGFEVAGATVTESNSYLYIFLNESVNGVDQIGVRLARVPKGTGSPFPVDSKSSYQYWNGSVWVPSLKDSMRIMDFPTTFNGVSVAYNAFLGKWTAVYTTNKFSAVAMRTAPAITGPWTAVDEVLVDCTSVFPGQPRLQCYFGRQHPELEKNGGETIYVSYSNEANYQAYLHEIVFNGAPNVCSTGCNPNLTVNIPPNVFRYRGCWLNTKVCGDWSRPTTNASGIITLASNVDYDVFIEIADPKNSTWFFWEKQAPRRCTSGGSTCSLSINWQPVQLTIDPGVSYAGIPPQTVTQPISCCAGGMIPVTFTQVPPSRPYNGTVVYRDNRNMGSQHTSFTFSGITSSTCANSTVPSAVELYFPPNNALVGITGSLSWYPVGNWGTNCSGTLSKIYKVYLDQNPNPTTKVGEQPSVFSQSKGKEFAGKGIWTTLAELWAENVFAGGPTNLESFPYSGLQSGKTYYWKVEACNGALCTTSSVASFITQ